MNFIKSGSISIENRRSNLFVATYKNEIYYLFDEMNNKMENNDAMFVYDRTIGWPGIYWIARTSSIDHTSSIEQINISNVIYKCNSAFDNNKEIMHQTHAFIRAMNWWNDLFWNLSQIRIFQTI